MIAMLLFFFISLAFLFVPVFWLVEPTVRALQFQGRAAANQQLAFDREEAYIKVRAIRASPHLNPEDRDFLMRHGWIDSGKLALEQKKEREAEEAAKAERDRVALEGQVTSLRKANLAAHGAYGGYSGYHLNVTNNNYVIKDMRKRPMIIDEDQ